MERLSFLPIYLVTSSNILKDVYLIEGYIKTFSQYGIEKAKYSIISKAITDYYNNDQRNT